MADKTSVLYMTEYLKYATIFERNVYIWSRAMKDANAQIQRVYDERNRLEQAKREADRSLATLDTSHNAELKKKRTQLESCRKRVKYAKVAAVVIAIGAFITGCLVGAGMIAEAGGASNIPKALIIILAGLGGLVFGSIFSGGIPICIGVMVVFNSKAGKLENEIRGMSNTLLLENRRTGLQNKIDQIDHDVASGIIEESAIGEKQMMIHSQLQIAQQNLRELYAMNLLPEKYRNMNAVATLYEYLVTGRCNSITGHGGIYDTYETEKVQLAQLEQQVQMNQTLIRIEDGQRRICQEIRQANSTLSDIRSSLSNIEYTNQQIATNTAISAAANQQTAEVARYMAWKAS